VDAAIAHSDVCSAVFVCHLVLEHPLSNPTIPNNLVPMRGVGAVTGACPGHHE